MKRLITFSVVALCGIGCTTTVFSPMHSPAVFRTPVSNQITIEFKYTPRDRKEHLHWNNQVDAIVQKTNERLIQGGYIAPALEDIEGELKAHAVSWPQRIRLFVRYWYYRLFFHTHALSYPKKSNHAFFIHKDHDFGFFTLYVPDGVAPQTLMGHLYSAFEEAGLKVYIDKDHLVIIGGGLVGLEGQSLTLEQLSQLRTGVTISQEKMKLEKAKGDKHPNADTINTIKKRIKTLEAEKNLLYWHQQIPTTGLRPVAPFYPPAYPYVPHAFTLWQLAPKKGAGVSVAVIDTGISAFNIGQKNKEGTVTPLEQYKKNQDLAMPAFDSRMSFNLVADDGLDPVEQLVILVQKYVDHKQLSYGSIERSVIQWIAPYLNHNDDSLIREFLIKHGKSTIAAKGTLTAAGKNALRALTTGANGIKPAKGSSSFSLAQDVSAGGKEIILQCLPAPEITSSPDVTVAGHGSHTSGIVGGRLQGPDLNIPSDDTGICGIAPHANIIMLKAFGQDGSTTRSHLISALKKAVQLKCPVVNMSLKIAEKLDLQEQSAITLKRLIGLIPYVVAASGNAGDPELSNYVGQEEAYPAKFASVPFDVGAFSYDGGSCPISVFSQYEPHVGPKLVAPGFNILSSALIPNQTVDSEYVFMDGTSMAAPIVSGFVALVLGEFQHDFSREELLSVMYRSTVKMHNNDDWNTKVLFGTIDMRTALFMLHVLAKLKAESKADISANNFSNVVEALYQLIMDPTARYGVTVLDNTSFTHEFIEYIAKAVEHKDKLTHFAQHEDHIIQAAVGITKPDNAFLQRAISYYADTVLKALEYAAEKHDTQKKPDAITEKLVMILRKKPSEVFSSYSAVAQKRLSEAEQISSYWHERAQAVREQS